MGFNTQLQIYDIRYTVYLHLLKAQRQCTPGESPGNKVPGLEESRAASGTVVVTVGDGKSGQAHLVECPLTPGRAAKHVADILCSERHHDIISTVPVYENESVV